MKEWLRYKSFDIPILRSFELKLIKNITYDKETYAKYIYGIYKEEILVNFNIKRRNVCSIDAL